MLTYFLRQLVSSLAMALRYCKAFVLRRASGAVAWFRRVTNVSRHAGKAAAATMQEATAAMKKPTKREDYIETQHLMISKSFLVGLAVALVALGLLIWFVLWPWFLSRFLTAHFYCEDQRVETWSGRVVVYADEKKTQPLYAGRLEDGVLQGEGTLYDEQGLVSYEGAFTDGVPWGSGTSYTDGVMTYRGEFADGVPNGVGTAYEDGVKCYSGDFVNGVYDGEGTAYYPDGSPMYQGGFSQGLYEGTGTEYDTEGQRRYTGGFVEGLREGQGSEYRASGALCYQGGFAAGLYQGEGSCYLEDGSRVEAVFAAGVTDGTISWYQNGLLWYQGAADDLTPDGFGTIYAESGKILYQGNLDQGTLDGWWLLSLTTQELREAAGDSTLVETDGSGVFYLTCKELGLTAACTYQQGASESVPIALWFHPDGASNYGALLPWTDTAQMEAWAVQERDMTLEDQTTVAAGAVDGPQELYRGTWSQLRCVYDGGVCTILLDPETDAPVELRWASDETAGTTGPIQDELSTSQEELAELVEALAALTGEAGAASEPQAVAQLVAGMDSLRQASELVDAVIGYAVHGETAALLQESLALQTKLLEQEQTNLAQGTGSQTAVDQAQQQVEQLQARVLQQQTAQAQAALTAGHLIASLPGLEECGAVLFTVQPTELDPAALLDAVTAYQKTLENQEQTDWSLTVQSAVLELNLAYQTVQTAQSALERISAQVDTAVEGYRKGTVTTAELYALQCSQYDQLAAVLAALGDFTQQMNQLNLLSGGYLAEHCDWMADAFAQCLATEQDQREQQEAEQQEPDAQPVSEPMESR